MGTLRAKFLVDNSIPMTEAQRLRLKGLAPGYAASKR